MYALRERLQTGFLTLNSIGLLRGRGKEESVKPSVDTYLKSYMKIINRNVIRDKIRFCSTFIESCSFSRQFYERKKENPFVQNATL